MSEAGAPTTVDDDLAFSSALDLARLVRHRQVSPRELVELFLSRIERFDGGLNSYVTVAAETARSMADAAGEAPADDEASPLSGVPISIKDLVDTVGIRSTHGTAAWSARVPDEEPVVVDTIRRAGMPILGKTNVPEFAVGGVWTEPLAYGATRNPWNTDYTPGGSSGGAAVAVAAGLCPLAHGTDDGGSIRIPASWCNVFGLKPSRGRISAAPEPQGMYFTHGMLTRTVADAAALLDTLSGYVAGDAFWAPPAPGSFLAECVRPPGSLRIAFTTKAADDVPVSATDVDAVERTAALLDELGHDVEEVDDWPGRGAFPDERILPLPVVYGARYAGLIAHGLMPPVDELEPPVQFLVGLGESAKASDYLVAVALTERSCRALVAFFDRFDAFLTPVLAGRPARVGERFREPEPGEDRPLQIVQFTGQFSASGQPAASVPAGFDELGLPVGVQLVGRPADEATLLRLSAQLEQARPWAHRRPTMPPEEAR